MVRGTFANVRLRNKLAPGTEGGVTRLLPEGEQMSIFDASVKYAERGVPLIILAGKEYGSGSSRDWAAKGPKLLGVRAVIAESFERIHRSNLVGMGILPLQFEAGQNAESLGLTGEEVYDFPGLTALLKGRFAGGRTLRVKATSSDGKVKEFDAMVRIDTPQEIEYYEHGGILQYVLRQLAAKVRLDLCRHARDFVLALVFVQHFIQQHAQVGGAGVAQLQIGRSGLRHFIGKIQRRQHGHAQRIGRAPVSGHSAHLGVNHRRQLANVHWILPGKMIELIVDLHRHVFAWPVVTLIACAGLLRVDSVTAVASQFQRVKLREQPFHALPHLVALRAQCAQFALQLFLLGRLRLCLRFGLRRASFNICLPRFGLNRARFKLRRASLGGHPRLPLALDHVDSAPHPIFER